MFTDMVGYTALGQRDESLALALVEEQRKLIRPILRRHDGHEVKTIGDAFLVEFPNALDAVRCAYDIQRAIREFNFSLAPDRRIHLRIGVHVGEVVESQGDISGDAVNVASRIEPLAEDGGVCLTRQVYDHVHNKFELPLLSIGATQLKNVTVPIEAYKIAMPWNGERTIAPSELDRRRIAVLPFASMSPDPNDEYFADGLTEELIAKLSLVKGLEVIARTSIMNYKRKEKNAAQIGKELKAGTLLEGSVRKSGNRIRATIQLINSNTESHLWAESYDRNLEDIFAVQSEIAERVSASLKVRILPDEKERIERAPTSSPEAFSLYLKGRFYWNERTKEGIRSAMEYFQKAIEKDSNYALAYSGLADCYGVGAVYGFIEPQGVRTKSMELVTKALEIDGTLAEAHATLGQILYEYDWNWQRSEAELRRAIELKPSYASAHHWLAIHLGTQGKEEESMKEIKRARELDPLSKIIQTSIGGGYWYAHRYEEGIRELTAAIEADPDYYNFHDYLGMLYVGIGRYEDAKRELERAASLEKNMHSLKADLGYVYARAGRKAEALAILDELSRASEEKYVSPLEIAEVYAGLGDRERCMGWVEKGFRERAPDFRTQVTSPIYDDLRSSPRFVSILKEIGVS